MVCFTPLELDLFTLSNCPDSKVPRDIWLVSMLIGMVFISAAIITAVMIICYCTHCRTFGVVYSTCVNVIYYQISIPVVQEDNSFLQNRNKTKTKIKKSKNKMSNHSS